MNYVQNMLFIKFKIFCNTICYIKNTILNIYDLNEKCDIIYTFLSLNVLQIALLHIDHYKELITKKYYGKI